MSTFSGINTVTSGLAAQQAAMSVLGQNIANATNSAYHRQQVVLSSRSMTLGGEGVASAMPLGSGVDVTTIRRMQDDFTESQLRSSSQELGRWKAGSDALDQVISLVNEPSDTGISSDLDAFWTSWQNLGLAPESTSNRNAVIDAGSTLASSLNALYSGLEKVQAQQADAISGNVDSINKLATQLASVNDQIQQTVGAGGTPNDLLDKRDDILSQLSSIVNIQVSGNGGAGDVISIGGHTLVQGAKADALSTGTDADGNTTVIWAEDSSAVNITSGALSGELTVANDLIPGYLSQLDDVAQSFISRVNELHESGYGLDGDTGTAFFTGTGAADIKVNATVVDNPRLVAAAISSGAEGDGSLAQSISKVKDEAIVGGSTIGDAYSAFVSGSAADDTSYSDGLETQTSIHAQLTTQQQSVSGVSLDEEFSDMVRFQQAYNASARVLTTMDSMIGTLISDLGGRG